MPDLRGRLAVVTGASRGIGAGIAVALARSGADIVGVSRSDAGEAAQLVRAYGRDFHGVRADVAGGRGRATLLEAIEELDRPIDILVNNAGIARRAPAERHADAQWDETIALNLTAPFTLARDIGRTMLSRRSGKIVFLGSMMSWQGGRDVVSYAASKSGVSGLVHALANEWAGSGVNVNAVAPGYIRTDLTAATHGDPDRMAAFTARIPAGRWGTAEDVAKAVVFLSSDDADYIHGVVLPVDGGWLVR